MKKYKILLVDDDPVLIKGTTLYLEQKGYRVFTADKGKAAIELLQNTSFDLVLTDLIMPGIDGFQVLKEAKKLHPEIMVVVMTGYGDVEFAIDCFRLGADDYMLKPCEPEEMLIRIKNCFEKLEIKKQAEQTEKKLHKLQEEILNARRLESLGILSGGIAHDFNNLLHVIIGYISLTNEDLNIEGKTSENLREAEKACIRAKEVATRLITFSQGGNPVKELTNISDVIKDAIISEFRGDATKSEISIPDDIRPAYIDAVQIKQVVHNIAVNAREAMQNKGLLKIYCRNIDFIKEGHLTLSQGNYIKISFEDQGCGISKEHLKKIFDPYFSTKDRGVNKGQGLGLAICHSIISKHKGLITAESEPGKGSIFSVYLPAAVLIKEPGFQESGESSVTQKPVKQPVTGKILVMDDEEMIRSFMTQILNRLGYDVETCTDGKEAIEIYKKAMESKKPFDVVILDLTNQYGMGGQESMRRLLEIDHDAKGIVSTGYSNDPVVSNFRLYGFSGFLTKPATKDQLTQVINAVISKGRSRRK